ncbi:DNA-directed DNA polymerase [Lentibacillus sp. JNUCC-1]|uniref:DNA polymerase III subunit beta n=1 Tax=Lentibacillus sp. JNUCC-1 TaxID=2654513 RepID=UPI0012E8CF04|nr:DNA polymerase III subunit beta [Lentibacillus sp. JNUCC-1]MUV37949.1 DNA-directed DNA polymerase [Lentibacillus sp. JNUCC-1]
MKFTIQRDPLIASIQDVSKAISPRTAIPILTGMKLDVRNHGVTLTGSDSDISIEAFIPTEENGLVQVENIEEGSIVIQSRYFSDIVRKLPEKTVEISVDEQLQVTIRSGKAVFNLNGQDASEYPQLPKITADESFSIDISLLKNLIKQTVFAVSSMETRPILTGIKCQMTNNTLNFTATDSYRLAAREIPVEASIPDFTCVVPGKSMSELNKILDDSEEQIDISLTKNQILFQTPHLSFMSRLLEGNYPETSRLIPDDSKTSIQANTRQLINTVDRASLLAQTNDNSVVKLVAEPDGVMELSGHTQDIGQVTEEFPALNMEGESLNISFSSAYMLDALKAIDSEEIKIEFTGAMRPFIIRPANDNSILQLIVPVRTY